MLYSKKLIIGVLFLGFATLSYYVPKESNEQPPAAYSININQSTVPGDIVSGQTPSQFAWQEFIALNWPVESGQRGVPDTSSGSTFASITSSNDRMTVWQTYPHKAETISLSDSDVLPAFSSLAAPDYTYSDPTETFQRCDGTNASLHLYNNLDEASQLGLCVVNGNTYGTTSYQVLFEAKVNPTEYEYIRKYSLNQPSVRQAYAANTKTNVAKYGGTCNSTTSTNQVLCLPCGNSSGTGALELKASWRALSTDEINSNKYYTQDVIVYKPTGKVTSNSKMKDIGCVENVTYGLVGLHIIQKTNTYKAFLFATFEHVDNFSQGLQYVNNPEHEGDAQYYKYNTTSGEYEQSGSTTIDSMPQSVTAADFATIPSETTAANNEVWAALPSSSIWNNYKLVGVQGTPIDYADRNSSNSSYTYYLANNVTETNLTLRTFIGPGQIDGVGLDNNASGENTVSGEVGTNYNLYSAPGVKVNTGGCQGCHGIAQLKGGDFSFLLTAGSNRYPEPFGLEGDNLINAMNEAKVRSGVIDK